eukprot:4595396-Prymnesium_polylepis.1
MQQYHGMLRYDQRCLQGTRGSSVLGRAAPRAAIPQPASPSPSSFCARPRCITHVAHSSVPRAQPAELVRAERGVPRFQKSLNGLQRNSERWTMIAGRLATGRLSAGRLTAGRL